MHKESTYSNPYTDGMTSWMDIYKDSVRQPIQKFPRLRSLIAHELSHACQYRYSGTEEGWFMEHTSVYIENLLCKDVNVLRFNMTERNLLVVPKLEISSSLYYLHQSGAIWAVFLHEFYGDSIIRCIWERCGNISGNNTISGIDWVLRNYFSSNLKNAFKKYAVWRYFTGDRADNFHFSQSTDWETSTVNKIHSNYPVYDSINGIYQLGGASFVEFTNGTGVLELSFDGENGYKWGAYAIGYKAPDTSYELEINLNNNDSGEINIPLSDFQHITLVVVNIDSFVTISNSSCIYKARLLPVSITFKNRIGINNAGGKLLIDNVDTVESGQNRSFTPLTTHSVKTLNERFITDSIYKNNNWNGVATEFKMIHDFIVYPSDTQKANFNIIYPIIVKNELIDAPSINFGSMQFRDPWYLHDAAGNQFNRFDSFPSPYRPTGAYNKDTGGVFLNQGWPSWTPPYYSVGALSQNIFTVGGQNYTGNYYGWSGTNVEYKNANALQTGVVFRQANAIAKARYKAFMKSGSAIATYPNSQKKIVTDGDNGAYLVYESGGYSFLTSTTNDGASWSNEQPIIDMNSKTRSVSVYYDEIDGNAVPIVERIFTTNNGSTWVHKVLVGNYEVNSFTASESYSAQPSACATQVLGYEYQQVAFIVWKELSGLHYAIRYFNGTSFVWIIDKVQNTDENSLHPSVAASLYPIGNTVKYSCDVVWEQSGQIFYQRLTFTRTMPTSPPTTLTWLSSSQNLTSSYSYMLNNSSHPNIALQWIPSNQPRAHVMWHANSDYRLPSIEKIRTISSVDPPPSTYHYLPFYRYQLADGSWSNPTLLYHSNHKGYYPSIAWLWGTPGEIAVVFHCENHAVYTKRDLSAGWWNPINVLDQEGQYPNINARQNWPYITLTSGTGQLRDIKVDLNPSVAQEQTEKDSLWKSGPITPEATQSKMKYYRVGSVDLANIRTGDSTNSLNGAITFILASPIMKYDEGRYKVKFTSLQDSCSDQDFLWTSHTTIPQDTDSLFLTMYLKTKGISINTRPSRNPDALTVKLIDINRGTLIQLFSNFSLRDILRLSLRDTIIEIKRNLPLITLRGKTVQLQVKLLGQDQGITPLWNDIYFTSTGDGVDNPFNLSSTSKKYITTPPNAYILQQNYSNPFNPSTNIKYSLPENGFVKLAVFNILGQQITVLVNEQKQPGFYSTFWDAQNIPSGVYFIQMVIRDEYGKQLYRASKKLLLVK